MKILEILFSKKHYTIQHYSKYNLKGMDVTRTKNSNKTRRLKLQRTNLLWKIQFRSIPLIYYSTHNQKNKKYIFLIYNIIQDKTY